MVAVGLKRKKALLYSPITITPEAEGEIKKLGKVEHILAPNMLHHLYAGLAKKQYPGAGLYGPIGLQKKRKDLIFDGLLDNSGTYAWQSELETHQIEGMKMMQETVLFHKKSKTLICSDLIQNFKEIRGAWTKFYLRYLAGGIDNKPGLSRAVRFTFNDKKKARAKIDQLIALKPEKIIMAHGDVIEQDAANILTEVYAWLKG